MAVNFEEKIEKRLPRRMKLWEQIFFIVFILYSVGLIFLLLTQDPLLFPGVVLLGNFMVPLTFVAFLYDNRHLRRLPASLVVLGFFYGGTLGVFMAAGLETILVQTLGLLTLALVGLVEELAKILPLFIIVSGWPHRSETNGMILGAAVGMGFAALESLGYSFVAFLESGGSVSLTVGITLLRGILSPLGHGAWTAILAGVLFRESRPFRFSLNRPVILAFLGVAALHSLWDGLPAVLAIFLSPGVSLLVGEGLIAGISAFVLYRLWQEAKIKAL